MINNINNMDLIQPAIKDDLQASEREVRNTPKSMIESEGSSGYEGQKKSFSHEKVMTKMSPRLEMSPARRKKLYTTDILEKLHETNGHQLSCESPQPFLLRE